MVPLGPPICAGDENDDVLVPAGNTLNSNLVGSEMRGVEFIDLCREASPTTPQRAYALQRRAARSGRVRHRHQPVGRRHATPTDVLETCSSPTFLYQHDSHAGEAPRLFVNCFDTGEVYVFDPAGPTLLTTFIVGRGPAGMVFDTARPLAYVLDFSQNDVSVVDLAPGSPTAVPRHSAARIPDGDAAMKRRASVCSRSPRPWRPPAARRRTCCRSTTSTGRPTSPSCASARFSSGDAGRRRHRRRRPTMWQVSGRPMQACHPQGEYDPGATIADPDVRVHAQQRRRHAVGGRRRSLEAARPQRRHRRLRDALRSASSPSRSRASDDGCRLISAQPRLLRSDAGRSVGPGGDHLPAGDRRCA